MSIHAGARRAYATLDHIIAHPDEWNQKDWVYGTAACFAGRTILMAGGKLGAGGWHVDAGPSTIVGYTAPRAAELLLGCTEEETDYLFAPTNTLDDLIRLVADIFGLRPRECCDSTVDTMHESTCPEVSS